LAPGLPAETAACAARNARTADFRVGNAGGAADRRCSTQRGSKARAELVLGAGDAERDALRRQLLAQLVEPLHGRGVDDVDGGQVHDHPDDGWRGMANRHPHALAEIVHVEKTRLALKR
jgi:hypothetical protein